MGSDDLWVNRCSLCRPAWHARAGQNKVLIFTSCQVARRQLNRLFTVTPTVWVTRAWLLLDVHCRTLEASGLC